MAIFRGRGDSDDGMHVAGDSNQINTGSVKGDMTQSNHMGHTPAPPALVAARAEFARLRAALDAHEGELSETDRAAARRWLGRIDAELSRPQPDRQQLGDDADGLSGRIGTVAALVTITQAFIASLQGLAG
ncbi:hypothetical protein [Streptomyces indicus]|uniref:Uncharacterized protein n=1 Tax=Streptomyces indicus TaxID=417292 RepID=A0A1G8YIV9_9ACTN|nr:hypothetical protein [Streptomyces indicus]SDK02135.1 hypothetical protein SAMN05421806_10464 [Streptomyces indicus]